MDAGPTRRAEMLGWTLLIVLSPTGFTLLGMLVLLAAAGMRLARRLKGGAAEGEASVGPAAEGRRSSLVTSAFDAFGWSFFGAALASAAVSSQPLIAFGTAIGFLILFGLVARGSVALVSENPPVDGLRLMPWVFGMAGVNALYGLYVYFGLGLPRAEGIATTMNGFGGITAFFALVVLGYMLEFRRYALGLPVLLLLVAGLLLSFSRGSWMGFAASLLAFGGLAWRRIFLMNPKAGRRAAWVVLLGVVAISVAFAASEPLRERLATAFSLEANRDRLDIWGAALRMAKDHPLLGVGGGVFPFAYEEFYRPPGWSYGLVSFAHNLVLHVLAEFGILGLVPFLGIIGSALYWGWRAAVSSGPLFASVYAGYIGFLVHDMFDNVTFGMNIGGLFWLLTGLMVHAGRRWASN